MRRVWGFYTFGRGGGGRVAAEGDGESGKE